MYKKTIRELHQMLADKSCSAVELLDCYLQRIQKHDNKLNSFITVNEEVARQQAENADKLIQQGKIEPLTGIPIAHKDIFCTQGIKTSCASKMLDNFISPYDATVVEKLSASGTVLLGKTNMDEFAMGASNEHSFYGPVANPWDMERVPGGSSGGSAAAIAARLVPATTGTDTGGSIRQPAAFCGITGLKPTYGRVSRFGMIAFASSLDQGGPMAQTAEDCAIILQAMAGFDKKDSTSIDKPVPDYSAHLNESLQGLKVGVIKQFMENGLNDKIATSFEQSMSDLKKLGVEFKTIDLPCIGLSNPVYYVIAPAESSSNLSRYDGVRFGHRCESPVNLEDLYKRSRSEGFGAEVKRRIMIGTYVLSAGYYDAYYLQAQRVRRMIRTEFADAFKDVDVIIAPTTPSVAFEKGEKKDPVSMYNADIFTNGVNLAGLPAISVPGGFIDGLPIGIQFIGNYFQEEKLLNVAHQYQQVTDWHQQIPPLVA